MVDTVVVTEALVETVTVTESTVAIVTEGGEASAALFLGEGSSGLVPDPGSGDDDRVLRADGTWGAQTGAGGTSDHGALTGLTDDDHTQYLLVDGSRALSGNLDVGTNNITNVGTVDGRDVSVDGTKLDGVEANATADQTGAEIKALYEAESDTNAFTDAEKTKLAGVETGATADQSDLEIETAYNNQVSQVSVGEKTAGTETSVRRFSPKDIADMAGTHGGGGGTDDQVASEVPFTPAGGIAATDVQAAIEELDSEKAASSHTHVLADITDSGDLAALDTVGTSDIDDEAVTNAKLAHVATSRIKGRVTASTGDVEDLTAAQVRTLLNVEDGATADQTGAEIKALYEAEADTNAFTDADESKLDGIEAGATADQTAAEVPVTPAGGIASSNVQDALEELDSEKAPSSHTHVLADITDSGALAALDTVGTTEIDDDAVTSAKIADGAVGTNQIANGSVDATKTAANSVTNGKIVDNQIQNVKLVQVVTNTIKGRVTAGTGVVEDLTASQVRSILNVEDGSTADQSASEVPFTPAGGIAATDVQAAIEELDSEKAASSHTHVIADITDAGNLASLDTVGTAQIDDEAVTNAKLAHVATARIKGRSTAGTGDVEDLTATQARGVLFDSEFSFGEHTVGFDEPTNSISTGTATIDWTNGNYQSLSLTENVTLSFIDPAQSGSLTLLLEQDTTGGRTVSFPTSVVWAGGTAPTISTGSGARDLVMFVYIGGAYHGAAVQDFS